MDADKAAQMAGQMFEMVTGLLKNPATAEAVATFVKNYHDALIAQGFTEEQAIEIVLAQPVPMPGGK